MRRLEALRVELRPAGVGVVTIAPGYIRTPMTAHNPYRMPFLMDADRFAARAARAIARQHAFLVFDVQLLQLCLHLLQPGAGEGDMVEAAGVLELLLGAAHHDALARLALAQQVHGGDAARVQPVAGEAQRRTVAVLEAEDVAVEVFGALEVGRLDGEVLQDAQRHCRSPVVRRR